MSSIIIPDADGKLPPGYREEIRLPEIEIPKHLQEDLDANPHRVPEFYQAVGKALNMSLNAEETRLRVVTAAALKERIEAIYRTLVVLRHELGYSLKKCFDLLPGRYMESLRQGERPEDTFERTVKRNMWASDKPPECVLVDREQLEDHTEEVEDDTEE
jgi:hypothetical protein